MRIRILGFILMALIVGGLAGALEAHAEGEGIVGSGTQITVISYGEFVPIDQVEARREALVQDAFANSRITIKRISPDGSVQLLTPTVNDLQKILEPTEYGYRGDSNSAARTEGDEDYDGDEFEGEDESPPLYGEYIADIASISIDFESAFEAGIEVSKTETSEMVEYSKTYQKNSREEQHMVSKIRELQINFGAELSGTFGASEKPPLFDWFSGGPSIKMGISYTRTKKWSEITTTTVLKYMESYLEQKFKEEITVGPNAGFLRTQLLFENKTHFPADLKFTNFYAQAVAYDPRLGDKYSFGEIHYDGEMFLYGGPRNKGVTRQAEFKGINTVQMEGALSKGYMFDWDISGEYRILSLDDSIDWRSRMTQVYYKTAGFEVHFGDEIGPIIRYVAIEPRTGGSLTVEKGLIEIFGAENIEFGQHPVSGQRIVTRIAHRQNRHAERDFDSLSPEEKTEYGRWIVGYQINERTLTSGFSLNETALLCNDAIGVYFITQADFIPAPPLPDETVDFNLPADGGVEDGGKRVIKSVKVGDVIEIDVTNYFSIYIQRSKHKAVNFKTQGCGAIRFNTTCYSADYEGDDRDIYKIPNLDWYKLKFSFATTRPKTWLSPSQLGADIVYRKDYPEYKFKLRFRVTEQHLKPESEGVLWVMQDQDLPLCGCKNNQKDCTRPCEDLTEERGAQGEVRYFKYRPDADQDSHNGRIHGGDDLNDFDPSIYPGAPELWDGKDNDQDGGTERIFISGPTRLEGGEGALFSAEIYHWDGETPEYSWYQRTIATNGSLSGWRLIEKGETVMAVAAAMSPSTPSGRSPFIEDDGDTQLTPPDAVPPPLPVAAFDIQVRAIVAGSSHIETATQRVHCSVVENKPDEKETPLIKKDLLDRIQQ